MEVPTGSRIEDNSPKESPEGASSLCLSTRLGLALLLFLGYLNGYLLRANMSLAIVCMVNHSALDTGNVDLRSAALWRRSMVGNISSGPIEIDNRQSKKKPKWWRGLPKKDGEFVWDKTIQGIILGSFYYGYLLNQIPAGLLADRFGAMQTMSIFMLIATISTLLTPVGARVNVVCLIILRVLVGIGTRPLTSVTNTPNAMPSRCTSLVPAGVAASQHPVPSGNAHTAAISDGAILTTLSQLHFTGAYFGMFAGTTFQGNGAFSPTHTVMWRSWAPPKERTRLVGFVMSGSMFGNGLSMPISAYLCENGFAGGWPSIFYVMGILSFVWVVLFWFLAWDHPEDHPRISTGEFKYIRASLQREKGKPKYVQVPWVKIITSPAVWALGTLKLTFYWGLWVFLSDIPTYMYEDLKFDIRSNGIWSAMPFIGLGVFSNIAPLVVDALISSNKISTTLARKLSVLIGSLLPAAFLIGLAFTRNIPGALTQLITGVTLTALQLISFGPNPIDIAPPFAGIITALTNMTGAVAGIAVPSVVAAMTYNQTHHEWQRVFIVTAAIYAFGGIVYFFFGSAKVQPWAREESLPEETVPILSSTKQQKTYC